MSALEDLLEDFGTGSSVTLPSLNQPEASISESELEGQKLEAFEKGYRAGWDDAVKAHSDDRTHITSALGQHLQDLSFTYQEAYSQMMNAVSPLLTEMVGALLPEMARATLGHHIAEQLEKLSNEIGGASVEIAVAPGKLEAVGSVLDADFGFPIQLVEDDTLSEEQADIRFSQQERQIDLGDLIASVSEAVQGFAYENQRKTNHG
ncbi:ABC transporter ATP-binding protein [Sagittula sp. NFXS13]|uniref:Flagellar assembly protein FliH n=1 Tax=Sagittula marina TaxID=943940 RepID=A0A7W6DYN6_9RHOB|nr:ABC transporter ATP-binding protein [Sagittula marina]MBB3987734.1 flagellar assembly protein FliH [Sagittula marina]